VARSDQIMVRGLWSEDYGRAIILNYDHNRLDGSSGFGWILRIWMDSQDLAGSSGFWMDPQDFGMDPQDLDKIWSKWHIPYYLMYYIELFLSNNQWDSWTLVS